MCIHVYVHVHMKVVFEIKDPSLETGIYVHICTYMCTHICIRICIYTCKYTYTCIYVLYIYNVIDTVSIVHTNIISVSCMYMYVYHDACGHAYRHISIHIYT